MSSHAPTGVPARAGVPSHMQNAALCARVRAHVRARCAAQVWRDVERWVFISLSLCTCRCNACYACISTCTDRAVARSIAQRYCFAKGKTVFAPGGLLRPFYVYLLHPRLGG